MRAVLLVRGEGELAREAETYKSRELSTRINPYTVVAPDCVGRRAQLCSRPSTRYCKSYAQPITARSGRDASKNALRGDKRRTEYTAGVIGSRCSGFVKRGGPRPC